MTEYEYMAYDSSEDEDYSIESTIKSLNELGEQGWVLCWARGNTAILVREKVADMAMSPQRYP